MEMLSTKPSYLPRKRKKPVFREFLSDIANRNQNSSMRLYPQIIEKNGSKEYMLFQYGNSEQKKTWIQFYDLLMRDGRPEEAKKIFNSLKVREVFDELILINSHI